MNFIKNDEVKLHYIKKQNNDSNKWYIFIPGAVNSAEEVASDLATAEFNYFVLSLRGRGLSTKGAKSASMRPWGMPQPVSRTSKRSTSGRSPRVTDSVISPWVVNFRALPTRLTRIWRRRKVGCERVR